MDQQSYWQQIERYFVEKRGNALMLSPKDWPLLSSWEERQLPLDVIYEGIDQTFERFEEQHGSASQQTITSLHRCKHAVEEAWNRRKTDHPQDDGPDKDELFELTRQRLLTKLRSTRQQLHGYASKPQYQNLQQAILKSAQLIADCLSRIEAAQEERDLFRIEGEIRAEEQKLFSRLGEDLCAEERERLFNRAEAKIRSHKQGMSRQVYQETVRLAFLQEIHDAYPLPSFL
ncbi:hypothetical protein CSB45_03510 [candidate division KSB3 bacterium]|uniref:Uncharacterized protein n=1 Tax=candidate division KSB3 bacterium TaxID=2044937 RepID=A0A2G6E966_9BACT|nr:MAG: hypothetical protein CSB45_03510 [candidate division KSB3 bacterium]PIE29561.1 MAG: hypothetical protein CSA57_08105 [candidate division KSB3 bacterium]